MKRANEIIDRLIGVVEKLQGRFGVGAERLRAIENRLARLDGGDDARAAVVAAEKQVAARKGAKR
jgi:hypothetical protein